MRKYIINIVVLLIFLGVLFILLLQNKNLKDELLISKYNEKALIADNDILQDNSIAYQITIEQLKYFNDSITNKLDSIRHSLDIKDRNIKHLQYILSIASKKDTVNIKDTIFINSTIDIDTTIKDDWYKLNLGLRYPSSIIVEPTFISEKCIFANYKKETINPPKKCKFLRMFQKKHKVIEVEVIDNNPYIINKKQKFIEIIK